MYSWYEFFKKSPLSGLKNFSSIKGVGKIISKNNGVDLEEKVISAKTSLKISKISLAITPLESKFGMGKVKQWKAANPNRPIEDIFESGSDGQGSDKMRKIKSALAGLGVGLLSNYEVYSDL